MNIPYLVAQVSANSGEHWGPGPLGPLFLLLWLAVLGAIAWFLIRSFRRREPSKLEVGRTAPGLAGRADHPERQRENDEGDQRVDRDRSPRARGWRVGGDGGRSSRHRG